jgi:hypothetical protein
MAPHLLTTLSPVFGSSISPERSGLLIRFFFLATRGLAKRPPQRSDYISLAADGSLPVTRLTNKKGSFNIQLFYEGNNEPDTIVFRTDDPSVPLYRRDSTKTLTRIRVISNPV